MSENSPPTLSFIDSNVWLYAFIDAQDTTKQAIAVNLITSTTGIVVSSQVVNEVAVNLLKKAAFTEEEIRLLMASFYQQHTVMPLSLDTLVDASHIREQYRISYWDSLILASARASGARTVYTEDMHDGLVIEQTLRIVNPFK